LLLTSLYFVNFCLAGMHKHGERCLDLIKLTANSLSGGVVTLMLVAVQKDNLELSINHAIQWWVLTHKGTRLRMTVCIPIQDEIWI
jgi:hypothetical protein